MLLKPARFSRKPFPRFATCQNVGTLRERFIGTPCRIGDLQKSTTLRDRSQSQR